MISLVPFACSGCRIRLEYNHFHRKILNTYHFTFSLFYHLRTLLQVPPPYTFCLWDLLQVYSIRDAAANNLKRLAEEFGPEWAMQHIVPQVL